jgi:hypothetical protein
MGQQADVRALLPQIFQQFLVSRVLAICDEEYVKPSCMHLEPLKELAFVMLF